MITRRRIQKVAGKIFSRSLIRIKTMTGAEKSRRCSACSSAVPGFFRYGDVPEWGCPICNASPRERLVNYAIANGLLAFDRGAAILHIAPNELSLVKRFRQNGTNYLPADLDPSRYAVEGITRIDLMEMDEESRFDLVYASHVMEHVPDDRLVFANLHRSLRPGGQAWLMVPLHDAATIDGGLDMPPETREKLFGQWDHVRQYGMDFRDRLEQAGFSVSILKARDLPAADQKTFGLDDMIFVASVDRSSNQDV
jgi:SAM-dependent methyltransferase